MRLRNRLHVHAVVLGALAAMQLWMAPPAQAADVDVVRAGQQREKGTAAAKEFVQRLGLSRWQARRLIPILEEAAALQIKADHAEIAMLPEMIDAFSDFLEEDRVDNGFSQPVERRTARVNHRAKQVRDRLTEDLIALEKRACEILKPKRRELAEAFRPGQPFTRPMTRNVRPHRDPLVAKRREMHEIHKQRHPQLGQLGRLLLRPGAYEEVCSIARMEPPDTIQAAAATWQEGSEECSAIRRDAMRMEISQLRAKINNWNLINGLHFAQDQIRQIVEVYDEAVWEATMSAGHVDCERPLSGYRLMEVERTIEAVLSPAQGQVVRDYKPCLIPPKNLKDPVRVGQANDSSHMEHTLARARKVPARQLPKLVNELIDRETQHFGELSRTQRAHRRRLLINIIRKAAAMSDTEFELNRVELAERISREDLAQTLRVEIDELTRARGQAGLVARFMINEPFMDQLKERGQQLADGVVQAQVDLAKGPQAENCDTSCTVK